MLVQTVARSAEASTAGKARQPRLSPSSPSAKSWRIPGMPRSAGSAPSGCSGLISGQRCKGLGTRPSSVGTKAGEGEPELGQIDVALRLLAAGREHQRLVAELDLGDHVDAVRGAVVELALADAPSEPEQIIINYLRADIAAEAGDRIAVDGLEDVRLDLPRRGTEACGDRLQQGRDGPHRDDLDRLRRLRLRLRRWRLLHLAEERDHVGAILRIVETGERHPVVGNEATRIGQERVEVGFGPDDPGVRQRRRVPEVRHAARDPADDAHQVGTDPVPPLIDLMAGGAAAEDQRAVLGIGARAAWAIASASGRARAPATS